MVEFYNLDSRFYKETQGIEKRDYFMYDNMFQEESDIVSHDGKKLTRDLEATAHDLLRLRREAET
jgi:hypothetical protein